MMLFTHFTKQKKKWQKLSTRLRERERGKKTCPNQNENFWNWDIFEINIGYLETGVTFHIATQSTTAYICGYYAARRGEKPVWE